MRWAHRRRAMFVGGISGVLLVATAAASAGGLIPWMGSARLAGHTAPTIQQGNPLQLTGAGLWLHSVIDAEGRLVLSAAEGSNVEMAYFDPTSPTASPQWKTVITAATVGTTTLTDHWHVYANGHHWIVVAGGANGDSSSWLFELDDSFNIVGKVQVVNNGLPTSTTVQAPNSHTVLTNDMFMVAESNGITVAHFLPGTGHRLFRYDFNLQLKTIQDIGGGPYTTTNGASAFATSSGFTEIAPTSLNPTQQSTLEEINFDSSWNPQSVKALVNLSNTNVAMGTALMLAGGYLAVTARVISPLPSSPIGIDNGNVVRYIFDSNGNQVSSTTIDGNGDGNRPHTLLINGTSLITGWDNGGSAVHIEIDTVSGGTTTTTSSTMALSTTTPSSTTTARPATSTTKPPVTSTTKPATTSTTTVPKASVGYWMLGSDGTVYNFGSAGSFGNASFAGGIAQAMVATPDGGGYWVANNRGEIDSFGDAAPMALSGATLPVPLAGIARTPDGKGLWTATSAGQVLTAGDAKSFGDLSGKQINVPVVAMAATPDGKGYWLLGGDGGVFTFGDAGFFGSTGGIHLNKPAVAMASTADGQGYFFVASDGGMFAYGDAVYYGSVYQLDPAKAPGAGNSVAPLNSPADGIVVTPDGKGYWMVASDGGVLTFGDAGFVGSMGGSAIPAPIVAFAPV